MSHATKQEKAEDSGAVVPQDISPYFAGEIERMMNDFWRHPFLGLWNTSRRWPAPLIEMPVVDVYEEKDAVVVKAEVPGLSKEDLNVTLTESTLTIKGEIKKEDEIKEKNYFRNERSYGRFARSIELPVEVKTDQIKASFKNGILEIRLPKIEDAKKKTVKVEIN